MDKWDFNLNYQETKEVIGEKIENIRNNFIEIGFFLKQIRDNKTYEEDGYKNIYEFAQDIYGITRSTASRWMEINDKFSKDGNSPELAAEFKEYGKSQLQEMLYLDNKQLEEVKPDMTVREIKEIRKPAEEEVQEEPVSILGYPLREYPEGSLLTKQGCGTQSCFNCHRDGCELRQEACYCVEAPMGNPFPCTTLNVVDMLREEIGSRCQFVNEDLAYHRAGDGQPVPCCKKCNNKCGYACSRAEEVLPEQEVCDIAQEPEEQEVRHFTSDISIDNAYGWTWSEVVKEYFETGYSNPEKECTISFLGKIYKVLKRADVTVFYDESGKTLFDVTNERLQEEYEQSNKAQESHQVATSIDELDLSVRTYNCLKRTGVDTIEQLKAMSDEELAKIRNFGKYNMDEVHNKLKEYDAAVEECATSHTEENVIPEEDFEMPNTGSVVKTEGIVIENSNSVVEEELTEETMEDSDLTIVKKTLAKENRMLGEMQKCFSESDWRVRKQKLLVGALENYVKAMRICEMIPEEELIQPELPVLKNNDMRKGFLEAFHDWPIWFEVPEASETYYRYNLPDGSSIVICEYKQYVEWKERYADENPETVYTREYLLKPGYHYLNDCKTNTTTLVEHLKEVQKNGR